MGQIPFRSLVSSQTSHDKVKDMIACVLKCKRGGEKSVGGYSGQTGGQYNEGGVGGEGGGEWSSEGRQGSRGGGESIGEEGRAAYTDADADADALAAALSSDCYLVSTVLCPFLTSY